MDIERLNDIKRALTQFNWHEAVDKADQLIQMFDQRNRRLTGREE